MKKLLLLLLCLMLCLSGCFADPSAEGFYPEEFLMQCKLADMPLPSENIRFWDEKAYCFLSDAECENYAGALIQYLSEKEDVFYKGYYYEMGTTAGIFYAPEYRFAPLTKDSDPDNAWFAFSLTETLNDGDEYNLHYKNGVSIRIRRDEGSFKKFKYNTVIEIKNDPMFLYYYGEK